MSWMTRRARSIRQAVFCLYLGVMAGQSQICQGQDRLSDEQVTAPDDGPIIRVEEDWVIHVVNPDWDASTPQLSTAISPDVSFSGRHVVFELNHATLGTYVEGGMQLQMWNGDWPIRIHTPPTSNRLGVQSTETITFTKAMEVRDWKLTVEVLNGQSTTWGTFGSSGTLKVSAFTLLTDLSKYSPDASVVNSGVGRCGHQVQSFCLSEVRRYTAKGLVNTDSTDRCVHEYREKVSIQTYDDYKRDLLSGDLKTLEPVKTEDGLLLR